MKIVLNSSDFCGFLMGLLIQTGFWADTCATRFESLGFTWRATENSMLQKKFQRQAQSPTQECEQTIDRCWRQARACTEGNELESDRYQRQARFHPKQSRVILDNSWGRSVNNLVVLPQSCGFDQITILFIGMFYFFFDKNSLILFSFVVEERTMIDCSTKEYLARAKKALAIQKSCPVRFGKLLERDKTYRWRVLTTRAELGFWSFPTSQRKDTLLFFVRICAWSFLKKRFCRDAKAATEIAGKAISICCGLWCRNWLQSKEKGINLRNVPKENGLRTTITTKENAVSLVVITVRVVG